VRGRFAIFAVIGKRFDVVVTDDADRFNLDTLERLARLRLHRLGVTASSGNISLEQGSQAGESISVQLERADTIGLVYVEAPELEANALAAGAERLAEHLRRLGIDAVVAPHEGADTPALLIASADKAEEKQVRRLLDFALDGVVVLCRSWCPDPDVATPLSADARAALHLGWRVRKSFADGLLLEKDGRVAVLVNEPQGELPTDELVIDLIRRVEARGWSPIVCWRDAPRDPANLARLLQGRSTALVKNEAITKLVRQFVLSPPPPVPEPPNDKGVATERSEADSSAPAVPELVADPIGPTAVLDDSTDGTGGIERVSKVGDTQQINGASPAEDPALVTIQEAGSFLAIHGDKYPSEEIEALDRVSANGLSNVPWSANLKEEGSETVAQVDNTASSTETTDAPHGAEAAAVEQPVLFEGSTAFEEPSEPAPASAVAVDEESQAATEHRQADSPEDPDPKNCQIRRFLQHPLELPSDIGADDDQILRAANDILLDHLKIPDSIRFLSDVTFGPQTDARLVDTLRRTVRHEQVQARMSARPYAEAFQRVSTTYPVLLLWTMATAVIEQYATSNEKDVWQHAFRAIGLNDAEVGTFTSETVSSKISAIARLYRFDCNTRDGYRHCMKLFMCGGVPKSQMGILADAFRSAERGIGGDEGALDAWIREAIEAIPLGYTRLRRILGHPDAIAYADAYKRARNGQSTTSPLEAALFAALSPAEAPGTISEAGLDSPSLRPPTIVWRDELRVASAGYATEILDGSGEVVLSLWPDDEFAIEPVLAFEGFGWRLQGADAISHVPGILQRRPFTAFDESGAELGLEAGDPPDGTLFTAVARAPFVLRNSDETCDAHEYGGIWIAAGLFSPEVTVEVEGSIYLVGSPVARDTLKPEFAEGGRFVRCEDMPGLAVGLEGFGLCGAGAGVVEILVNGRVSKEIMGLPGDRAAEVRVRVCRDGRITAASEFVWWPNLHRYAGTSLPGLPTNLLKHACQGIIFTDEGCVFDMNDPRSHVTIVLSDVRQPLRLPKRGVHLALRRAEQTEWLPKGQTVCYRRGESDGRLRVIVSNEEGTLRLYGGRPVELGRRRSWYDVALQGALADDTERISDAVEWTPIGGETIRLFRLVEAEPVVRWDEASLVRTEQFSLQLGTSRVLLAQATALDVFDLSAFDRLGAQGIRDCAFLEYAPDNRQDFFSFRVDLGRLPGRARMWQLQYRLAFGGQSWDDAEPLGAARYYLRRSRDLALTFPTGLDYEHLCRVCADASGDGKEDLANFLREATLEIPKQSQALASGFAESLGTWRGASAFDACPDLLMDADWNVLASSIAARWSIDTDECPPTSFLGSVPNRLARSLEQHDSRYTAIFDYLVPNGVPKIRPRDPYALLKPEVHLWAYHMALERLRGWHREGMSPDQEQTMIATARRMAQLTSRVTFNAERLATCRRDDQARELARYLSPALFGFLWCTRGNGYPLSGRRTVAQEWLEIMRLKAHDVGLLLRLAPEMLAFHLVLVENLAATEDLKQAVA
jgi:hypothetical protein